MIDDFRRQAKAHELLRGIRRRPPATHELATFVIIRLPEPFLGQFRDLLVLLRLDDVRVNLLQVAPQSALFLCHWPSSSRSRAEPRHVASTPRSPSAPAGS